MEAAEASSPSVDGEISPIMPFLFGSFFFVALFAKEKAATDLTKTKRADNILPYYDVTFKTLSLPRSFAMSPRVVILERSEESCGATSLEDDTAERSIYKVLVVTTYYGEFVYSMVAMKQPIKIQIITE